MRIDGFALCCSFAELRPMFYCAQEIMTAGGHGVVFSIDLDWHVQDRGIRGLPSKSTLLRRWSELICRPWASTTGRFPSSIHPFQTNPKAFVMPCLSGIVIQTRSFVQLNCGDLSTLPANKIHSAGHNDTSSKGIKGSPSLFAVPVFP